MVDLDRGQSCKKVKGEVRSLSAALELGTNKSRWIDRSTASTYLRCFEVTIRHQLLVSIASLYSSNFMTQVDVSTDV